MQFRLYVLYTAWLIDKHNNYQKVRKDIAAIKVLMPGVLHDIAWRAIQVHGALGISNEMPFHSMMIGGQRHGPGRRPDRGAQGDRRPPGAARPPGRATTCGRPSTCPKRRAAAREKFAELPRARSGELLMIDIDRLARGWTTAGLGVGAPIEHAFVSGGSQNEIYEIRRGDVHGALRIPPPSAPETRDEGILREWRIIEALDGTDVPHTAAIAACEDRSVLGTHLLPDGLRRRLVADEHRRVAGALRHRPRGQEGPGLRAGRRHLPAVEGRLAGEGPPGPGPARRVPRAPGRPVDGVPRAHQGARAARVRRGVGLASQPPADRLRPRASCTATTSSPTSCSGTGRRPGWPPSWTGRWARWATPSSTWPGSSTGGRRTLTTGGRASPTST